MNAKFLISTSDGRNFHAWLVIGDPKKNDNWTKVAEYRRGFTGHGVPVEE